MVRSMYAAIAGLRAHQSKMDVIGNNIANVNTPGFKTAKATFQEAIYQTSAHSTAGNDNYGGTNAMQVGYGSKLGAIDLVFATSNLAPTGNATDCMIDGEGFFLVGKKRPNGIDEGIITTGRDGVTASVAANGDISQLSFSRVGDFKLDSDGYLCDKNGNVVYGYTYIAGATANDPMVADTTVLRPIKVPLPTGAGANDEPPQCGSVAIDAKGVVTGKISGGVDDGKTVTLGQIAIGCVPNPNGLEHSDGPYYQVAGNAGKPQAFAPQEGNAGKIVTGGLEAANVDLSNEFAEMITTQRGFQANSRIITVTDQMLEELVNLKR